LFSPFLQKTDGLAADAQSRLLIDQLMSLRINLK